MSGLPKAPAISEKAWQTTVLDLARRGGWRSYHTFDSRRSSAGFPDLVLVRPPELIFVEVKAEKGKTTPEQDAWLEDLGVVAHMVACVEVVAHHVRVFVWRPSDFDEVCRVLLERAS
jgi:ribosomal protein L37E